MRKPRQPVICASLLAAMMWSGGRTAHAAPGVSAGSGRAQMDPITGLHWQWTRDAQRPEAPPRLTRVQGGSASSEGEQPTAAICVRTGDRMRLRMRGAVAASMTIEATALASGRCGDRVPVRVLVTSARIEITVLGAGEGILEASSEAWR